MTWEEQISTIERMARELDNARLSALVTTLGAILRERQTGPDPHEMLTLEQGAKILNLDRSTLRRQAINGHLTATKGVGRDWLVSRADLHRYALSKAQATRGKVKPLPETYQAPAGMNTNKVEG